MSAPHNDTKTITIVFRGLMVFHFDDRVGDKARFCEVGFLPAEGHQLRINTMRNHNEIASENLKPADAIWELYTKDPKGISIHTDGQPFTRLTHSDERDFRWLVDLEGPEFYNEDLTNQVNTSILMPVLHIPSGELYTSDRSKHNLQRAKGDGEAEEFGKIAVDTGCDITTEGDEVTLVNRDSDEAIFTFKAEPNTTYEIVNTPPGPPSGTPGASDHVHPAGGSLTPEQRDHFQNYYKLFKDRRVERFQFAEPPSADPAPEPTRCGGTGLLVRTQEL